MWLLDLFSLIDSFAFCFLICYALHSYCRNAPRHCSHADFAGLEQILQHGDGHTLASAQSRLAEEGRPNFFPLRGCWFFPRTGDGGKLALCSHRPLEVRSNQGLAERGGTEWRALCFYLCFCLYLPRVAFSMEEIYAKFVSQKISKTRWRPLSSGSLQTAETFATGSWDNEVPLLPGQGAPASSLPPRTAPPAASARTLSDSSFSRPSLNACLMLGCPVSQSHRWCVCLSLESRCVFKDYHPICLKRF